MSRYRLIKEYPNSPELGYITDETMYFPSSYPEFWELIKEKKFEIVQYNRLASGVFTLSYDIKTVKRLSDNTLFSLGDKIKMIGHANDKAPESITEIELNKEGVPCLFTNTFRNNGINIFKAIKCEKLLTSEDGIDMYQNDIFWHVDSYFGIGKGYLKSNEFNPLVSYKHFSTEKAAKDWIDLNKPMYSKKQIMDAALVKYVTGTILLHIKDIK